MGNIASKSSFSSYIWIIKIISIAACISFLKDQDKMVNALRKAFKYIEIQEEVHGRLRSSYNITGHDAPKLHP